MARNKRIITYLKTLITNYNIIFILQIILLFIFLTEICLADYYPFVRWEIAPLFLLLGILGLFILQILLYKLRIIREENVFPYNRLKDKNYLYLVILFIILCYIFHSNGGAHFSIDDKKYYAYVKSLAIDGDLDFQNEYQELQVQDNYHLNYRTKAGRPPNIYPPGSMSLWLPFFILIHFVLKVISHLDLGLLTNGVIQPYKNALGLATIFYACIAFIIIYKILKEYVKKSSAIFSVMLIILSTFLLYYIVFSPLMSTICEVFMVSLFIYLWLKQRKEPSIILNLVLGIAGGLLIFIRATFIVFLILPLADIISNIFKYKIRSNKVLTDKNLVQLTSFFPGIILGAIPLFLVWKAVYGEWFVNFSRYFSWLSSPHIFKVLFSWRHGLISWSPIILFSLIGLVILAIKKREIGISFCIIFLLLLYINASQKDWWAGGSFGARRFASLAIIFAFGFAFFLQWIIDNTSKKAGITLWMIFLVLMIFNFLLMYQFEKNLISRSDSVRPLVMLKHSKYIVMQKIPESLKLIPSWLCGRRFGVSAQKYHELSKCEPFSNDFTIDIGGNDHLFIGKNWGTKDRTEDISFRWSLRGLSTLLFPLKDPSSYLLLIHCWPYTYPNSPQHSIELEINGHKLTTIPIKIQSTIYSVKIPEEYFKNSINELKIISAHSIRPCYFSPTLDPRKISVAFDYFSFKRIN
jgi:hypothetical protein